MPGTDLFLQYAEETEKGLDNAQAAENLKGEILQDDLRRRKDSAGPTEIPPPAPDPAAPVPVKGYPIRKSQVDVMGAPDIMGVVDPLGGESFVPPLSGQLEPAHVLSSDPLLTTIKKGGRQIIGGGLKGVGGAIRNAAENLGVDASLGAAAGAVGKLGLDNPGLTAYMDTVRNIRSAIGLDKVTDYVAGKGKQIAKAGEEINRSNLSSAGTAYLQQKLQDSVASVGLSFSALGVSFLTKNPMLGLSIMGVISGGQQYQDSREFGDSPSWSSVVAGLNATAEVATEKLPLDKLLEAGHDVAVHDMKKFVKDAFSAQGLDMGGELGATFSQDIVSKMSNRPDLTTEELRSDMIDTFWSTSSWARCIPRGPSPWVEQSALSASLIRGPPTSRDTSSSISPDPRWRRRTSGRRSRSRPGRR